MRKPQQKDLVPKEGLSDEKYAGICRCFEESCVIVYRTAVLLKKHPEKLCLTCRIETDIFNFAKIVFSEMLAAKNSGNVWCLKFSDLGACTFVRSQ